jgi:hypothetical protein
VDESGPEATTEQIEPEEALILETPEAEPDLDDDLEDDEEEM